VDAIADGAPERAQKALRGHLSHSLAFIDQLRIQFPGYFKE
jgi:DNA-binding GntR family transcriptional regulator